jgi:hypothetical protein
MTDRFIEVQLHYGDVVSQPPHGVIGIIPWMQLTATRLRMERLLLEWRLYTAPEKELVGKIKKVQYRKSPYAW